MDPRKPILRPDEDQAADLRATAYRHLLACTETGARATGMTGASFVILGMGIWAGELFELDPRAAAQLLHALGDLFDPTANDTKKRHAEKRRRAAVKRLLAAVDLDMATPGGCA